MTDHPFSVAIDGPSGAGKSTLARRAAKRFGFLYVDTGAIYRCVGLACLRAGIGTRDAAAVEAKLPDIRIRMAYNEEGEQRMFLNGDDVSAEIRLPEVSIAASDVSALPVGEHLLLRGFEGILLCLAQVGFDRPCTLCSFVETFSRLAKPVLRGFEQFMKTSEVSAQCCNDFPYFDGALFDSQRPETDLQTVEECSQCGWTGCEDMPFGLHFLREPGSAKRFRIEPFCRQEHHRKIS